MNQITLDPVQQSQLAGVKQQMPVCDQAGNLLGFFLPPELYKKLIGKTAAIPFTDDQLEQFRRSGGGCSLAEFWQKMSAQ